MKYDCLFPTSFNRYTGPHQGTASIEDLVRCCDFIEVGGYGDQLLDWLFGEIISYVKEHYLPGRVLTDRDNIAIIGKKIGPILD